jgi:hypothetical protein
MYRTHLAIYTFVAIGIDRALLRPRCSGLGVRRRPRSLTQQLVLPDLAGARGGLERVGRGDGGQFLEVCQRCSMESYTRLNKLDTWNCRDGDFDKAAAHLLTLLAHHSALAGRVV